jgi:tetratricopeptide (TPR) repeat protein
VGSDESIAGQNVTVHRDVHTLITIKNMSGNIESSRPPVPELPVPEELLPEIEGFHNHDEVIRQLTEPGFDAARTEVLAGQPGSGKTSLAVHWANLVAHQFPDGRIHLDLRGSGQGEPLDVHEALGRLLQSLLGESAAVPADTDRRGTLWRSLSYRRRLLILLDDAAGAKQVAPLLPTGPHTVTVVTSRAALTELAELKGVRITTVHPLTPDESLALLRHLLGDRIDAQDEELRELADLCGHLQLALRVAATRLVRSPLLSAAELNAELVVERGRVLEPVWAVFESSYRHLRPESSRLFRLLGIAPGSILPLDAVIALTGEEPAKAKRSIEDLCRNHLLALDRDRRCIMQGLLQAYAAHLADAPDHRTESEAGLSRLGSWYATLTTAAALALGSPMRPRIADPAPSDAQVFSSGRAAQSWYRDEADNLTVLVQALLDRHMLGTALTLCQALVELRAFNNATSWAPLAQKGLDLAEAFNDLSAQAFFHESLGKSFGQSGQPALAIPLHRKSLELRVEIDDLAGQARSLNAIGLAHWRLGDLHRAQRRLTESRERAREAERSDLEALALMNLGLTALSRAELLGTAPESRTRNAEALNLLDAALDRLDARTQTFYTANALYNRALALSGLADHANADATAQLSVDIARDLANPLLLAPALRVLAVTKAALADTAAAEQCLTEAIEILRTLGDTDRETRFHRQLTQLRDQA